MMASWRLSLFSAFLVFAPALAAGGAAAEEIASPWLEGYKARTRLLAGRVERDGEARLLAFVEIELPPGWKTYWRNPGDAGGLPPAFNWSNSTNLASANVLYPAPIRMTDKAGVTIGYMSHVIFPVEIAAQDAGQPIKLAATIQFGICKEICVPVDAALDLEVPPDAKGDVPEDALAALERVPRVEAKRKSDDPALTHVEQQLTGPAPAIVLDAKFTGEGGSRDIFLEAPDNLYIPVPTKISDKGGGNVTFEVKLGPDTDIAQLKGKVITATLVDGKGASVASFKIE
jgi:DsbC/DsbD-like thiol-disulfide interchange protein